MKRYIGIGACHAWLTVAGWYFVAAAAQGVADGGGAAPAWLRAVNEVVLICMWPLARLALAHDPAFGDFSLLGFVEFALVAAVNSTLVVAAACLLIRGAARGMRLLAAMRDP